MPKDSIFVANELLGILLDQCKEQEKDAIPTMVSGHDYNHSHPTTTTTKKQQRVDLFRLVVDGDWRLMNFQIVWDQNHHGKSERTVSLSSFLQSVFLCINFKIQIHHHHQP